MANFNLLSVLTLCLIVSGCASTRLSEVKPLTHKGEMPLTEEESSLIKRSERLHNKLAVKGMIVSRRVTGDYLDQISTKIMPSIYSSRIEPEFFVLKDASINAFALPNGHIYLNAGLISQLSSESELAFVMGHEVSHVVQKDGLKSLIDRKNTVVGSHIANFLTFGTGLAYLAAASSMASFSRSAELDADKNAALYLGSAGYDLAGGTVALSKLGEVKYQKEVSAWSSHPDKVARISALEKIAVPSGQKIISPDNNRFEQFRQRFVRISVESRLRNKQFELAEDMLLAELEQKTVHPWLYYALGEANRLKATDVEAYAREYAWLHDKDNNEELMVTLREKTSGNFEKAKNNYKKVKELDTQFSLYFRGMGLLYLEQGEEDLGRELLRQYLEYEDIKDRRYITSLIKDN